MVLAICRYFVGVTFKTDFFFGLANSQYFLGLSFNNSISAVHQCNAIKVKNGVTWKLFKALILPIKSLYRKNK